jgi:hypothetical protein
MITVGKRGWAVVPMLAFALGMAATGCVASAAEIDAEDQAAAETEHDPLTLKTKLEERSTGKSETESAAGGAAGIPATPDPSEPQPSPWRPNGTALSAPATDPSTGTEGAPTTSPTATPQPSPWEGHVPPPNWPNTLPDQQTNAQ